MKAAPAEIPRRIVEYTKGLDEARRLAIHEIEHIEQLQTLLREK
jgi:hypothetical protein